MLSRSMLGRSFKGQFTIVALLMVVITLVVFVYVYPPIWTNIITPALANISDATVVAMINVSPFLFVVAILVSIIWYIVPQRSRY